MRHIKSISEIKREAKYVLKGNWGGAALGNFLPKIVSGIYFIIIYFLLITLTFISFSSLYYYVDILEAFYEGKYIWLLFIAFASLIIYTLLKGMIKNGLDSFFLTLVRKREVKINELISGFKKLKIVVLTSFLIFIFCFLWNLLYPVISRIMTAINVNYWINLSIGLIIYIGIYVIIQRYDFTYYVITDCKKTKLLNYIKQSKKMVDDNLVKFILFKLSFIGWKFLQWLIAIIGVSSFLVWSMYVNMDNNYEREVYLGMIFLLITILGLVIAFIGGLFLEPYIQTSKAVFYNELLREEIENGNLEIVELNDSIFCSEYNYGYYDKNDFK